MSETEIESILLRNLFSHGADGLAFAPIVAAGDNAAKPHAHARPDYRIKPGDALLLDFGGTYQGYSADITRTFFVKEVSDYDRAFYETVLAANEKGREVSRAGITASDVDDAVLRVLEQSQFARYCRHKTGHGLGLDVHEAPQIMRGNAQRLEPGMVFTIEPGLYREGETGVRIEDDVVVTETGIECLTSLPARAAAGGLRSPQRRPAPPRDLRHLLIAMRREHAACQIERTADQDARGGNRGGGLPQGRSMPAAVSAGRPWARAASASFSAGTAFSSSGMVIVTTRLATPAKQPMKLPTSLVLSMPQTRTSGRECLSFSSEKACASTRPAEGLCPPSSHSSASAGTSAESAPGPSLCMRAGHVVALIPSAICGP